MQMEGEIKLRNVQSIVLFLAISKQGKLVSNKKRDLGFNQNSELMSKFNSYHRKQYSGIVSSIIKDGDLHALSQSIAAPSNAKVPLEPTSADDKGKGKGLQADQLRRFSPKRSQPYG